MSNFNPNARRQGFTLVELCVVLIIIGLLMTVSGGVLGKMNNDRILQATRQRLAETSAALGIFQYREGRLPCPAAIDSKESEPAYAVEGACEELAKEVGRKINKGETGVYKGLIYALGRDNRLVVTGRSPVRSLNLKSETMADGWGDDFIYAVTLDLTSFDTYAQDGGGIFIADEFGNSLTSPEGRAQYALVSRGETGQTAINPASCAQGAMDGQNCDGDAHFVASPLYLGRGAGYFDDYVDYGVWISPDVAGLPQNCHFADAAPLVDARYRNVLKGHAALSNMKVSDSQSMRVCLGGQDKDCEVLVCSHGKFVKAFIDLK